MSRIDNRPVRIHAYGDLDEERPSRTQRAFDYAALVRRGRSPTRIAPGSRNSRDNLERDVAVSHRSTHEHNPRTEEDRETHTAYTAEERELVDRLPSMVHGVVKTIVKHAIGSDYVISEIARTIERFCTDPAVSDAGQWDLELELDPAVLPHTTLLLHLSPLVVRIRFRVRDAHAKQLISDYRPALKMRLEKSMSQHGSNRDIEIDID